MAELTALDNAPNILPLGTETMDERLPLSSPYDVSPKLNHLYTYRR